MDEQGLRSLIGEVKEGRTSRRDFIRRMVALGLTAPMASTLLSHAGLAQTTDIRAAYKGSKAGGGGPLRLLWWQAPTLLNPHFATGTKDQEGSRIFYEPLAAWDDDGNLVPVLAAEIPSVENGTRREGRPVGHLEAEARREVARRQAVHGRRRACSTRNTRPTRRRRP